MKSRINRATYIIPPSVAKIDDESERGNGNGVKDSSGDNQRLGNLDNINDGRLFTTTYGESQAIRDYASYTILIFVVAFYTATNRLKTIGRQLRSKCECDMRIPQRLIDIKALMNGI